MKRLIAMIAAAAMLAAFSACGAEGFDKSKLTLSEYNGQVMNEQVRLFVKQRTVTDETEQATMALENLTELDYSYDAVQRLEVKLDGDWYVVPDKQEAVILSIDTLPAGATDEYTFFFAEHYDKLTHGSYRIVKQLVGSDGSIALAAAEFDIA